MLTNEQIAQKLEILIEKLKIANLKENFMFVDGAIESIAATVNEFSVLRNRCVRDTLKQEEKEPVMLKANRVWKGIR